MAVRTSKTRTRGVIKGIGVEFGREWTDDREWAEDRAEKALRGGCNGYGPSWPDPNSRGPRNGRGIGLGLEKTGRKYKPTSNPDLFGPGGGEIRFDPHGGVSGGIITIRPYPESMKPLPHNMKPRPIDV
jgi:hypothetical protein